MSQHLIERLGSDPVRSKVIDDCVALIDNQVRSKGLMIRTAYGTVKALKKNFVREVVDTLLDDWLSRLQPHHDKWSAGAGGSFADHLIARSDDVAENLLAVTDVRADRTSHGTAKKLYSKMRPTAKTNVVEAIPELARLVERNLNDAAKAVG
jgi:hypothetical protein